MKSANGWIGAFEKWRGVGMGLDDFEPPLVVQGKADFQTSQWPQAMVTAPPSPPVLPGLLLVGLA